VLKKKKKGCSGKDLQKKEGFKSGMKERVADEKLIIISQMLCTAAINTSNTTRTQTGAGRTPLQRSGF